MKVLLVCAMGMSTSVLMKKLEKYADENGVEDFKIEAINMNAYKDVCAQYDCILLGPQVSYQRDNIAEGSGLPTAVIPPADYAIGNCANIFKLVHSLIDQK